MIAFGDLPGWPRSTVQGHIGRLVIGQLEEKDVLVMQGRIHYYEGYSMAEATLTGAGHAATGDPNPGRYKCCWGS